MEIATPVCGLVRNDPEFGCGNLHRIPGSYRHPFVGAVIDRPQKCVDFQSNSRYMAPFRRKIANIDTFPCRALNERPYTLKETVFFYRWKLPYQESGLVRNDPEFDTAKRHPILYLISHISYLIPHSCQGFWAPIFYFFFRRFLYGFYRADTEKILVIYPKMCYNLG